MIYYFDQFEVDDQEFRFSMSGTPVSLEPKALRLLICLIENRNRLVRKQELLDKVWPDAMVTENALTRAIGLLRKALQEDSRAPRYIETVPTAGYRFIAPITTDEENPAAAPQPQPESAPAPTKFKTPAVWLAALVLLLAVAAAGAFLYLQHGKKLLTDQDKVVLADFEDSTGDPVFDSTLRRGLETQLEQSPYLSLIPDDRIQQVLGLMNQPANTRLTPAIAREICVRTASAAVLEGSIAPLGSQYVLGLRAKDCQSGKVLAEEQVQAAKKEDVLHALDQIAGKFRTRLGESLSTVEKYHTPVAEVTTSSLEALKAYSLGVRTSSEGSQTGALPFLRRAVELDPNFAVAYLDMSEIYREHMETGRAVELIGKAYALRNKVSEWERLWIEVRYFMYGTGELEKAQSVLELLKHTYPRNSGPHEGLGMLYRWLGESGRALAEAKEAQRLNPRMNNSQNFAADLVDLNRFDEAEAVYKAADERVYPFEGRAKSRYYLAFLQGNTALMAQLAASTKGMPGEDVMLGAQADTEAWHGRLANAREFNRKAVEAALTADAPEVAAGRLAWAALIESDFGSRPQSRANAHAAMKLSPSREVLEMAALALARCGDAAAAEKLANQLDHDFPRNTLLQKNWLPVIQAATALQHHDPARAIEVLQTTSDFELANTVGVGSPSLRPVYLRGEAYLMLQDGSRAAAEFQKFIDHRGMVRNSPWGSLARLGLARAYALQGDTQRARGAYRDFLTIWKDADPDLAIPQQAKRELAKL